MKYKHTRKEIITGIELNNYVLDDGTFLHHSLVKDLLAQKEDRKEKVELFNVTGVPLNTPIMFKRKNGRIGYGKVKPTPSPLELPKMHNNFSSIEQYNWAKQVTDKVNKLYQYLKEK